MCFNYIDFFVGVNKVCCGYFFFIRYNVNIYGGKIEKIMWFLYVN